jgi:CDGSH-type Zn-finger protein
MDHSLHSFAEGYNIVTSSTSGNKPFNGGRHRGVGIRTKQENRLLRNQIRNQSAYSVIESRAAFTAFAPSDT